MTNSLRHLQPVAPVRIVFAIILSFLAIYLFAQGTLFGIILLGVALKLGLREGVEIDLNARRYRKVYSVFAVNFGSWKALPKIEYISVFKTKKKSRSRVVAAEANLDFVVYKLNLFHNTNKHIEAYVSDDKNEAFKVANHIALVLETEVYDATTN